MKKKYYFRSARWLTAALFAMAITLGIFGCGSLNGFLADDADSPVPASEQLSTVPYMEIRDPNVCARHSFAAGEVPAIKIQGCGGKEVRLLVAETESGKVIVGQMVQLKNGQTYYRPLPHIRPGSYKVSIAGQGVTASSQTFTVGSL